MHYGEPGDDTVLKTAGEIMRAYGNVEHAMREAITHAFGVSSFSFFSEALTIGHYKFNVQEFQWFILFKNKGKANKSEPVVLEPVRPVPVVLKARPKPASKSAPVKEDVRDRAGTSSSASATVIAPKARPPESRQDPTLLLPRHHHRGQVHLPHQHQGALVLNPSQTPESTNVSAARREVARIDLTDVRDPINEIDPRVPIPTPSPARSKGGWNRRHQQELRPSVPETSGISSSSRPWRPNQAPAQRNAGNRVRWASTRIYGNTEGAWRELWRRYPNVAGADDFWYDPPSGEWFVREWF